MTATAEKSSAAKREMLIAKLVEADKAITGTLISHLSHSDAGIEGAKLVVNLKASAQNLVAALSQDQHDEAFATLREAYTALAFAFRRIETSPRSRDGELCQSFAKVRGKIETVFKNAGEKL